MFINNKKIPQKILANVFEKQANKIRIKLNYNYYKLVEAIIKTKDDFNIVELNNKSIEELEKIKKTIEIPKLDRLFKDNLKFTNNKSTIPKSFKSKIKIRL